MTSALKKAKIEEEYNQYDRVVIRVQFHNKLVLQGLFKPRETIYAVQKFVKEYLEDSSLPFYLYTSPPKNVLKDESQSLIEARFVPATIIYFRSEEHRDHYLSSAVLSELSSKIQADVIAAACLNSIKDKDAAYKPDISVTTQSACSNSHQTSSTSSSLSPAAQFWSTAPATSSASQSGKPKWFKMGKK